MNRVNLPKAMVVFALTAACAAPGPSAAQAASKQGAVVPHEKNPDTWPQPDYFAEAQKLTSLKTGERFKTLNLPRPASASDTRFIVLPVQTQAFGFVPAFRAVVGAYLDRELTARAVDANRQTDIADAYGPFVRRLEDDAIAEIAVHHPRAKIVALYLGHDGAANGTFVTLVLRDGARQTRAHRVIKLPQQPSQAVESVAKLLPALLSEVGIAVPSAAAAVQETPLPCAAATWLLSDLEPATAASVRACHAITLGTLLPEFEATASHFPNPTSPAKMAWLATAFAEAEAFAATVPTYRAIREMAWTQLRLDGPTAAVLAHTTSPDPVVAPLARLLSAHGRSATMPVRSSREAAARYTDEASAALPQFARAVFIERASYEDSFRRVDLCSIEREHPGLMTRARCRSDDGRATVKAGRASQAEKALYQEWRIATYFRDLEYLGATQGRPDAVTEVMRDMPADVAAHPFVQQLRFTLEKFERGLGSFDAQLERIRGSVSSFVQATANSQGYNVWLAGHSVSEHSWTTNSHLLEDEPIRRSMDEEARLITVLQFDLFNSREYPPHRRAAGDPAWYLSSGPTPRAIAAQAEAARRAAAARAEALQPAPTPAQVARRSPFPLHLSEQSEPTRAGLEKLIAARADDMDARARLAAVLLKEGGTLASARAVIDAYPANNRSEDRVGQSHAWALPAHAFFFAGELDAAKHYYQRVRDIGTGSGSDMHADVRLRQIGGDVAGAMAASELRLRRYESPFARRDLTGFLFMTKQPERAWQVVLPGLASTNTFQLWVGAYVGHRVEGASLRDVQDWIVTKNLSRAQIQYQYVGAMYLHLHAVTDRIPTQSDVELLRGVSVAPRDQPLRWATSASLVRMALEGDYQKDQLERLRETLSKSDPESNRFMQPLFTWVAWHATAGKDPELHVSRMFTLRWGFDSLLSKAIVSGLDGNTGEAMQFLKAARYEMATLGLNRMVDRPIPAPYQYALTVYLLAHRTGDDVYRVEALRFVRGYQRVFPFWGWLYAMEALFERDAAPRSIAACRAQYLDPQSMFLRLSTAAHPVTRLNCKSALWWSGN